MNRAVDSPCHKCEDRKVGCHGTCKLYKSYRKEIKKVANREKVELARYAADFTHWKGQI